MSQESSSCKHKIVGYSIRASEKWLIGESRIHCRECGMVGPWCESYSNALAAFYQEALMETPQEQDFWGDL